MIRHTLNSFNPSTENLVGQIKATPPRQVHEIVKEARLGFFEWREHTLEERAGILKKAQQLLIERSRDIAEMITLEMGRPFTESFAVEVEAGVDLIGYYAKRADKFLKDRKVPLHNLFFIRRTSYIHFQPLGVMGIITPWNWSLLIPLGGIVPALLSGNAVVFKPSEYAPLVGEKIHDLFLDAGVPPDAFQIIQGDGRVGKALVQSNVDKLFFTGSTNIGQKILHESAVSFTKAVLEMGGSDAAVVCEDVNLDITCSGIVWGGFNNCGQNCNSIERVFVHEKIIDAFLECIVEKVKKLRVGDGMDPDTDIGPLASRAQLDKIRQIINKARRQGVKVKTGGRPITNRKGYFFEPTVLYAGKPLNILFEEELFGPLILVVPFKNDEQAITYANHSAFGLTATIWTKNKKRGLQIAEKMESGSVMVNDSVVSFGMTEAGWTGIKKSGIGWVHGEKGLDEMVNIQYINYDPQHSIQNYWWFPYSSAMIEGMKAGIQFLFSKNLWKRLIVIPTVLKHFAAYLLFNSTRKNKL